MTRAILACGVVLSLAGGAMGQVVTGWKTMVTSGTTLGEPQGSAVRTSLPPGVTDPSLTPSILNGTAPMPTDPDGTVGLYLLNTGVGEDNTGTNWTHLEAEGGNFGGFQGQMWTRYTGLLTSLRTAADTAFGADRWTIRKIWLGIDPTNIGVGCNAGLVSLSEVSATMVKGGVSDWGDKGQANTEDGGNAVTVLPAGFHGHQMGPTQASACVGVAAQQDAINPDFFTLLDLTGGPQVFPTGSIAFQQLIVGPASRVRPVQDDFVLYWAPIDDYTPGGQGYTTAVSYDGFTGASFGFAPYLLFELVKQPVVTGPTPPIANDLIAEAPFTAVAGPTCAFSLTASDVDLGDTLTFTITNPGSGGGTITPAGPVVGTNLGGGNWRLDVTYNVPANFRGLDTFSFTVSDGTNISPGVITVNVRSATLKNAIAFGANSPSLTDSMRIYNGAAVPDGGTSGTLNRALSPTNGFPQSCEFDNTGGIRHNPNGTLLAISFGPGPSGPGTLMAYRTTPACDPSGGRIIFSFDAPNVTTGPSRTVGLSVSPDNTRLAVIGVSVFRLYILNYNSAVFPPVVSLDREIDLTNVLASSVSTNTTWLDNSNVLMLDGDGNVHQIDINVPVAPGIPLASNPRFPLPGTISSADLEYNPEVSPNIYVAVGTFAGGASNTLYVCSTAGAIINQGSPQITYSDYSDGLGETFREIGFDCYGYLYFGTFVDNANRVNLKYLPNATNVAGITGGDGSLVTWRTLQTGEATTNFSGMDVAAGTTIGGGGTCPNSPPAASFVNGRTVVNTACTVTLSAVDYNLADTITFSVVGAGSAGGTLVPFGPITTTGNVRTQSASYTPASGFRGVESFSYKATDSLPQDSNTTGVNVAVRGDVMDGTVAFGGDLFDQNQTLRLYYGAHVPNGGTDTVEDVATGRSFASSTEFDNYNGVMHNPVGNLFSLRTGTATGGGFLYVYPTRAACPGNPATILYRWDGVTGGDLDRVSGLSISPDNGRMAVYGFDTKKIYFLTYTPGLPADVGLGGTLAATVGTSTQVDVSTVATLPNRSTGTAWLDNTTVLWVNGDNGDLYSVGVGGGVTLVRASPRAVPNLSSADVEYNSTLSDKIYVTVGEFLNPTTTNTLYILDRDGANNIPGDGDDFSLVTQAGPSNFTDHSAAGTGTFREIGLATGNKLFVGTFVESSNRVNVRYIDVATPGTIANNSSVVWNTQDTGQTLTSFSGLDVARGVPVVCPLPGDMNGDGSRNSRDIQLFTLCFIAAQNAAPTAGCECADMVTLFKAVNANDMSAFVTLLLQ